MVLDSFFNSIFGWFIEKSPLGGLLFISLVLTFLTTLSYKFFTDQVKLKQVKDDMTSLREKMKEHKSDPKKMMEFQKLSLEKSFEQMKHQIKPLLITMIPLIIIFGWLRKTYQPYGDLIGPLGWLGVYFISSVIFSIIIRKLMKVY